MDDFLQKNNNTKKILFIIVVFFCCVWLYSSIKTYFQNYFSRIEKKQNEIVNELKTIKAELNKPMLTNTTSDSTPLSLIQEIGKMKEDISKLKDEIANKDDVLGLLNLNTVSPTASPSPTKSQSSRINFVTIADKKWQTIDVFADKNSSSKIIGQAVYGKYYLYTKKEEGYYYITLSDNQQGWIHSQFIKEL